MSALIHEIGQSTEQATQEVRFLASAITALRDQVTLATDSAAESSKQVSELTSALVQATNRYVHLTVGLLTVATAALLFQVVQWLWLRTAGG